MNANPPTEIRGFPNLNAAMASAIKPKAASHPVRCDAVSHGFSPSPIWETLLSAWLIGRPTKAMKAISKNADEARQAKKQPIARGKVLAAHTASGLLP